MYFTGDNVFEKPISKKFKWLFFKLILPTPSVTSVLGSKTCSNITSRDFQFGVYNILYDFFLLT